MLGGWAPGPAAWTALVQVTEPSKELLLLSFCSRELSPLEEASLQNQKLRATYEARLARLNPSQAVQKTSLASGAGWDDDGPLRSRVSQTMWPTHIFWGGGRLQEPSLSEKWRLR